MRQIVFDEAAHRYTWADTGATIPSVTQIINEFIGPVDVNGASVFVHRVTGQVIYADVLTAASDFGSAVHRVVELALTHGIDAIYYPEKIECSVQALAQWQRDFNPEIIQLEGRMASQQYGYAGTFDILCYLPSTKRLSLIDVKTGIGNMTGVQTSAYERLIRENTGERKAIDRYKLRLPKVPGETYRLIPCSNPQDWVYFTHRLFAREFHANL